MRAMILIMLFLIALPQLGMAEAPVSEPELLSGPDLYDELGIVPPETKTPHASTPDPFADLPNVAAGPEKSDGADETLKLIIGPEAVEALKNNPRVQAREQACRKSKTEMEKYENCWLQIIRETYLRQHPSDLVELLISKLRLAEKKRITGKISKEEADVLRAEAHVQFQNGVASRTSIVRQEEQGRDDQERQMRILERDIKRSERDSQVRESEYQTERLRRELERQEREQARSERQLRDLTHSPTSTPTQTDCYTAPGAIHCTTR
jgi:hypothetical protein